MQRMSQTQKPTKMAMWAMVNNIHVIETGKAIF